MTASIPTAEPDVAQAVAALNEARKVWEAAHGEASVASSDYKMTCVGLASVAYHGGSLNEAERAKYLAARDRSEAADVASRDAFRALQAATVEVNAAKDRQRTAEITALRHKLLGGVR